MPENKLIEDAKEYLGLDIKYVEIFANVIDTGIADQALNQVYGNKYILDRDFTSVKEAEEYLKNASLLDLGANVIFDEKGNNFAIEFTDPRELKSAIENEKNPIIIPEILGNQITPKTMTNKLEISPDKHRWIKPLGMHDFKVDSIRESDINIGSRNKIKPKKITKVSPKNLIEEKNNNKLNPLMKSLNKIKDKINNAVNDMDKNLNKTKDKIKTAFKKPGSGRDGH